MKQEVKLLIIACNTIASVAFETVAGMSRRRSWKLSMPVPVRPWLLRNPVALVSLVRRPRLTAMHTAATSAVRFLPRVVSQACALFVPLVEEGWWTTLSPLTAGNTSSRSGRAYRHPRLGVPITPLKALLQEIAGPDIRLVDSAEAMADLTADLLSRQDLANSQDNPPSYRFLVSDVPNRFQTIAERFLGRSLGDVEVVKLPL